MLLLGLMMQWGDHPQLHERNFTLCESCPFYCAKQSRISIKYFIKDFGNFLLIAH